MCAADELCAARRLSGLVFLSKSHPTAWQRQPYTGGLSSKRCRRRLRAPGARGVYVSPRQPRAWVPFNTLPAPSIEHLFLLDVVYHTFYWPTEQIWAGWAELEKMTDSMEKGRGYPCRLLFCMGGPQLACHAGDDLFALPGQYFWIETLGFAS